MCKVLALSVAQHKCLMCGNSYKEEDEGEIPQEDLIADGSKSHSCVEGAGAWPFDSETRRPTHLLSPSSQQSSVVGVVSHC